MVGIRLARDSSGRRMPLVGSIPLNPRSAFFLIQAFYPREPPRTPSHEENMQESRSSEVPRMVWSTQGISPLICDNQKASPGLVNSGSSLFYREPCRASASRPPPARSTRTTPWRPGAVPLSPNTVFRRPRSAHNVGSGLIPVPARHLRNADFPK